MGHMEHVFWITVPEGVSTMAMEVLPAGQKQQAETAHLQPEAPSREQREVRELYTLRAQSQQVPPLAKLHLLKPSTTSPNSPHHLRTKVRIPEPVRIFLIQMTTTAMCTYFHLLKT